MKQLEIRISSFLRKKVIKVTIPEAYREMTEAQFRALSKLNRNEITAECFMCEFFGIPESVWAKLDPYYVYVLTELVRRIKQNTFGNSFFVENFKFGKVKRPLPHVPSMPLLQYMTIDTYAQWYEFTQKDAYLARFVSVLLVPDGVSFFDYEPNVSYLFALDLISRNSVAKSAFLDLLFNWQLIRANLASKFSNLFPSSEGEEGEHKKQAPASWTNIFDALIGDHLENIETYKRLPAFDVFRIIDGRIHQNGTR